MAEEKNGKMLKTAILTIAISVITGFLSGYGGRIAKQTTLQNDVASLKGYRTELKTLDIDKRISLLEVKTKDFNYGVIELKFITLNDKIDGIITDLKPVIKYILRHE